MTSSESDWIELSDPATNQLYYANIKSGETSWTKPDDLDNDSSAIITNQIEETSTSETQSVITNVDDTFESIPNSDWNAKLDETSGKTYYFNLITMETTWEIPQELMRTIEKKAVNQFEANVSEEEYNSSTEASQYHKFSLRQSQCIDVATLSNYDVNLLRSSNVNAFGIHSDGNSNSNVSSDDEKTNDAECELDLGLGDLDFGLSDMPDYDLQLDEENPKTPNVDNNTDEIDNEWKSSCLLDSSEYSSGLDFNSADLKAEHDDNSNTQHFFNNHKDACESSQPTSHHGLTELVKPAFRHDLLQLHYGFLQDQLNDSVGEEFMESIEREASLFVMEQYAEFHFNMKSTGMFSKPNLDVLLKHSKKPLKVPLLHQLPNEQCKNALQCFRNISGFMGDRKSGKTWCRHAVKLLRSSHQGCDILREEVFAQLLKQTRLNPDPVSERLGWLLILLCSSFFTPGDELSCYLRATMFTVFQNPSKPELSKIAFASARALKRTAERGNRVMVPLESEVNSILNGKAFETQIYFLHDAPITVHIGPQTTAKDAVTAICALTNVPDDGNVCIAEQVILPDFEQYEPLLDSTKLMDVITIWPLTFEQIQKKRKNGETQQLSDCLKLVFKVRYFLRENLQADSTSEGTIALMFIECLRAVHSRRHKLKDKDYIHLTALQLMGSYICNGKDTSQVENKLMEHLGDVFPEHLKEEQREQDMIQMVMNEIKQIGVVSQLQARKLYFTYLEHLMTFGASFFQVEQLTHTKKGRIEHKPVVIALSQRGLLLISSESGAVLKGVTVSELLTFGIKQDNLLLVVGTALKHSRLLFKTHQCRSIEALLEVYFKDSPAVVSLS